MTNKTDNELSQWADVGASVFAKGANLVSSESLYKVDYVAGQHLPVVATLTTPAHKTDKSFKGAHFLLEILHQYWVDLLSFSGSTFDQTALSHHSVTKVIYQALQDWEGLIKKHCKSEEQFTGAFAGSSIVENYNCSFAFIIQSNDFIFAYRLGDSGVHYLDAKDQVHSLFRDYERNSGSLYDVSISESISLKHLTENGQSVLREIQEENPIELIMLVDREYIDAFQHKQAFDDSIYDYCRYFDVKGSEFVQGAISQWVSDVVKSDTSIVLLKRVRHWYAGLQKAFDRESSRLNAKINEQAILNTRLRSELNELKQYVLTREKHHRELQDLINQHHIEWKKRDQQFHDQHVDLKHSSSNRTSAIHAAVYSLLALMVILGGYGFYLSMHGDNEPKNAITRESTHPQYTNFTETIEPTGIVDSGL